MVSPGANELNFSEAHLMASLGASELAINLEILPLFSAKTYCQTWPCARHQLAKYSEDRDRFVYATSQWEMMLHCNLGAYTKYSLENHNFSKEIMMIP